MKEFSLIIASSLVVIFLAVFFIHFTLNNFFLMNEICSVQVGPVCNVQSMSMLLVFTFLVVMAFIIVIETTIYYIFKGLEIGMLAGLSASKKEATTLRELERRKKEIKKEKNDARKKYFRREIEEKTYNDIKESYDRELMEVENELKKIKIKSLGSKKHFKLF
jgi:hypothetical protein